MKNPPLLLLVLLLALLLLPSAAFPCTAFFTTRGGVALFGNNEDFFNPHTQMRFVPAEEGRFGRVYFGFADGYPQGGMNDQGLVFDGFATGPKAILDSAGKPHFPGNIADEAMATCASVAEVTALFERYNLEWLETAMLFFADRQGDSVIIEGDEFLRKSGDFQVVTNFYQSNTARPEAACPQFRIAAEMLAGEKEHTLNLCRRILAATHVEQGSSTQYSNVYDLRHGLIYLYHFHNFAAEAVIDLEAELAKGAHEIEIASLFPRSIAFEMYLDQRERDREAARARRRAEKTDPALLDDYLGRYAFDPSGHAEAVATVYRDGEKLMASMPGQEPLELIPEGDDRFFQLDDYGTLAIRFSRGEDGRVKSVSILREELRRTAEAVRVE